MKKYLLILGLVMYATINFPINLINEDYLFLFAEPHRSIPFQIIYGGSSSGKSVAIAQRDVIDLVNEQRNFLICRETASTLRSSVFEERCKVIREWNLNSYFDIRKSDMDITYLPRGNKFFFRGLDDVEKIKSIVPPVGAITDIRVDEATETTEDNISELQRRMRGHTKLTKRVVLSFNPTFRSHWICKKYFKGQNIHFYFNDDILIFRTNYKSNKYLTKQDIKHILSLPGYQGMVYRDGIWGVLGDLIFTNWEIVDLSGTDFDNVRCGLDFGFAADPAAVVVCNYNKLKKEIHVIKDMYVYGGTNDVLAAKAKPIIGKEPVWCDSAEPKSISELRQQGENSLYAYGAKKGKDSVWHGIQWLQQQKILIDKKCKYIIDEITQYQWQKNKDGETLNKPVEKNDHCIAALRYATERDRLGITVNIV